MYLYLFCIIDYIFICPTSKLEDGCDDQEDCDQYDDQAGQEMMSSDDLRLHGPGHQAGQPGQQDDQWDAAVGEQHVGTALQYNDISLLHSHWSRNVEARLSLVKSFIMLLCQLSYAIKNQLKAPKAPY